MSFSLTQFGRHGPHNNRRRRLLAEDRSAAGGAAAGGRADQPRRPLRSIRPSITATPSSSTSSPRFLELLPRRLIGLAGVLPGPAFCSSRGIEALYAWMPQLSAALGRPTGGRIAALDLAGKGAWPRGSRRWRCWPPAWSRCWSTRSAATAWDDYRGRYRVWLWAALCWFLMATNAAVRLHEGFRDP